MKNELPISGQQLLYQPLQPSFRITLPTCHMQFDYGIKLIASFFKEKCCHSWLNGLEISNVFATSDSFLKAMEEAYAAFETAEAQCYFGTFNLKISSTCSTTVFFTLRRYNLSTDYRSQYICTLMGYADQIKISPQYDLEVRNKRQDPVMSKLTQRENEVLSMISDGYSVKEIANTLFLSSHTIESHKQKLYRKLNVSKTAELGKLAERFGLSTI